ncbi:hypothetical protein NTCA1_55050 [Novosphingobium sp. TCA1]|nr:hypothetical protein NTCA1_55050 [Novosphingobium sp. TCA1]
MEYQHASELAHTRFLILSLDDGTISPSICNIVSQYGPYLRCATNKHANKADNVTRSPQDAVIMTAIDFTRAQKR